MTTTTPTDEASLSRLRAAFDSQRCVSAWLGYGEVLFLGLAVSLCHDRCHRSVTLALPTS